MVRVKVGAVMRLKEHRELHQSSLKWATEAAVGLAVLESKYGEIQWSS